MNLNGDEMIAVGKLLNGMNALCDEKNLSLSGEEDGIAVWSDGEIVGYIGMFDDCVLEFRGLAPSERR